MRFDSHIEKLRAPMNDVYVNVKHDSFLSFRGEINLGWRLRRLAILEWGSSAKPLSAATKRLWR
jgi:hypothetical protein